MLWVVKQDLCTSDNRGGIYLIVRTQRPHGWHSCLHKNETGPVFAGRVTRGMAWHVARNIRPCCRSQPPLAGGEQEADFAHVSRVFGRMLSARRYVDVVATDIAAGLILLRHVQKAEVCLKIYISSRTSAVTW